MSHSISKVCAIVCATNMLHVLGSCPCLYARDSCPCLYAHDSCPCLYARMYVHLGRVDPALYTYLYARIACKIPKRLCCPRRVCACMFECTRVHTITVNIVPADRRIKQQSKSDDPKVNQKAQAQMRSKRALQHAFASGVKKAFLSKSCMCVCVCLAS